MTTVRAQRLLVACVVSTVAVACGGRIDGSVGAAPGTGSDAQGSGDRASGTPSSGPGATSSDSNNPCIATKRPCELGDFEYRTEEDACVDVNWVGCYRRDGFCGAPDTWCRFYNETECKGVFGCEQGWVEVETCLPDFDCHDATTCGHPMTCQKVKSDCDAALPSCGTGAKSVAGSVHCAYDGDCFTVSNECGRTVWCKRD